MLASIGCDKNLDLKPDTGLVIPKTVQDFQNLLDNADELMNCTPALAQLSADEYFIPDLATWKSLSNEIPRNAYIWDKDIFAGQMRIRDWSVPYSQVFYGNSVLDILSKQDISTDPELNNVKGWAMFVRAYAYYTLASNYCRAYNAASAGTDLGIPLKLSSNINEILQRNNLKQTYEQIIGDLMAAGELLKQDITPDKRNRPSKIAAFSMLARVYLSMREYEKAEIYADKALALNLKLTDFNTLAISDFSSFNVNSEEIIYFTHQIGEFPETIYSQQGGFYGIDPALVQLYNITDLRRDIYFKKDELGNFIVKAINTNLPFPFTGLAVDEIYLIKAECLARSNQPENAMGYLNSLVKTRIKTGTFIPLVALSAEDALNQILIERRKALVWRSLRWTDLKRLNMEGRNIVLTRNLDGQIFTLDPNSPKYVFPIPDDEISLSGIQQNIR